jgi:hypothetical protein
MTAVSHIPNFPVGGRVANLIPLAYACERRRRAVNAC